MQCLNILDLFKKKVYINLYIHVYIYTLLLLFLQSNIYDVYLGSKIVLRKHNARDLYLFTNCFFKETIFYTVFLGHMFCYGKICQYLTAVALKNKACNIELVHFELANDVEFCEPLCHFLMTGLGSRIAIIYFL